MEHRLLKGTELDVSRVCFGAMTFGGQTDERAAARMVERCLEAGVNFFDTANVYNAGQSEVLLGRALKGRRDRVILASKVRGRMGDGPLLSGLSKPAVRRAVEDSLGRLQTDYLDVYYLHQPDYEVPVEETLEALEELVGEGKIRYPATSNYSSWQVVQMLHVAERRGFRPALIAQQMYNLLARGLEQEFVPAAREYGLSVVAYNPLAGGLLTGKHRGEAVTPGTRFDGNRMYLDRYWHERNFRAVERLSAVAREAGRTLVSLSLNWLLHHTATDCVILGASRQEQLEENLGALSDGALPPDAVKACDEVWHELRGPVPVYNR